MSKVRDKNCEKKSKKSSICGFDSKLGKDPVFKVAATHARGTKSIPVPHHRVTCLEMIKAPQIRNRKKDMNRLIDWCCKERTRGLSSKTMHVGRRKRRTKVVVKSLALTDRISNRKFRICNKCSYH